MMNRRQFCSGAAAGLAFAQAQTQDNETGFITMFDGQTLQGWSVREGPETAFYVDDGAIVVHESAGFPTWLRWDKPYENFDFHCEFFIKGWTDSGIFLHAPEHGRNMWCGLEIHIFQDRDAVPKRESMGAVFPLIAPKTVNVRPNWNSMRILVDWPSLKVWTNDQVVQDINMEDHPELRVRLRRGYIGLESLSYPIRFRNLRVRELAGKEHWSDLYVTPADLSKWHISQGTPKFQALGDVLHAEGLGYLATNEKYRDFELQTYVRHSKHHNSGILFRTDGKGSSARHYEIQLHDVEGAHYPTGSLYHFERSTYPRIEPEQWYLLQMWAKGKDCLVRINGENVMEYHEMDNLAEGFIELQAHQTGVWTQFKQLRIRPLG